VNEKISVIVPAYNAAKTIERCAKSLRAQIDRNFEVIFVDDCSTDETGAVIKRICASHENFRVIMTKKNSGSAAARNTGIDEAKGELICFVDADDVVSPNYLAKMRELMESNDADVVCTKYARNKIEGFETFSDESELLDGDAAVDTLLRMEIDNGPVAKLFRKEAISTIRMPKVSVAEDLCFNYRVLKRAKRVVTNNSVLYSYIMTKGSLSTKFSAERMESLKIVQEIDEKEQSFYSRARVFMEAYFICERIVVAKGMKEYAAEYKTVCGILDKNRKIIAKDKRATRRQRLIAMALKFGPVFTARMMTAKSRLR